MTPAEFDQALHEYVAAGCPGEVNAFLDEKGIEHPSVEHEQRDTEALEAERESVVVCGEGYHPETTWVPDKRGGHMFSYCVPD
jgi:hypothetical protein